MASKIQIRRGLSSDWSSHNPVLSSGEFGIETDTKKLKIGDGSTSYNSLDYFVPFNLSELLDVSDSNPNSNDFISYDSNNTEWVFRSLNSTDVFPINLLSSGDSIKDSSNNSILSENSGTVVLDNVTFGTNLQGLNQYALTSNYYELSLTNNNTELNLYTANNTDTINFDSSVQYMITTNISFDIINNNLVLVI